MERKEKDLPTYEEMYSWDDRAHEFIVWTEEMCQQQIDMKLKWLNTDLNFSAPMLDRGVFRETALSKLSINFRIAQYIKANMVNRVGKTELRRFQEFMANEAISLMIMNVERPKFFDIVSERIRTLLEEQPEEQGQE